MKDVGEFSIYGERGKVYIWHGQCGAMDPIWECPPQEDYVSVGMKRILAAIQSHTCALEASP